MLYTELHCDKELFSILFHRVSLCCTLSNTVEIFFLCFVALCCALLYTELRCGKELFAVLFHCVSLCCTLSNTVEIFFSVLFHRVLH